MALPSSGRIKLSDVNTELGLSSTTRITLGQATVRTLTGVSAGRIRLAGDGYGKANRVALSYVFSSNTTDSTITASSLPGYISGKTDLTITVNSGIYVYSTNTANAGLTITGATVGDTVTLVNNGYIMGKGGNGGSVPTFPTGSSTTGSPGGPALSLGCNITMSNNSYIAGGGGGAGSHSNGSTLFASNGGGGGAGGGNGGNGRRTSGSSNIIGGTGATTPGTSGGNNVGYGGLAFGGGGGGMILPGVRNVGRGSGGEAGGAGCGGSSNGGYGGAGGEVGESTTNSSSRPSGGGGGWGSAGGNTDGGAGGGAGGKGIALNGYSVTYALTGTIYGAVS